MKLFSLTRNDKFRLAGDDNSPVFTFVGATSGPHELYYFCYDENGKAHYFVGYVPVILVK